MQVLQLTMLGPPARVEGANSSVVAPRVVNVMWSVPSDTGLGNQTYPVTYDVERSGGGSTVTVSGVSLTAYNFSSLVKGTTYSFAIRATSDAFSGTYSTSTSTKALGSILFVCSDFPDVAGTPQTVAAAASGIAAITLTWALPADTGGGASLLSDLSSYTIYVSSGASTSVHSAASSATSLVISSGLTVGQFYNFSIVAINTAGSGTISDVVTERAISRSNFEFLTLQMHPPFLRAPPSLLRVHWP